jgi:hypothetical protein
VEADAADSNENNSEAENAAAHNVPAMMEEKLSRSSGGSLAAEAPSKAAEVEPGQPSGGDADAERGAEKEEGGNIGMENGGEQQDMDRTAAAASTSGKVSCYSL